MGTHLNACFLSIQSLQWFRSPWIFWNYVNWFFISQLFPFDNLQLDTFLLVHCKCNHFQCKWDKRWPKWCMCSCIFMDMFFGYLRTHNIPTCLYVIWLIQFYMYEIRGSKWWARADYMIGSSYAYIYVFNLAWNECPKTWFDLLLMYIHFCNWTSFQINIRPPYHDKIFEVI